MKNHKYKFTNYIAAVCFKNAKQYEQAKDAYLKEAESHTENKTYLFTAPIVFLRKQQTVS